jgi:hypothetical protein
MGSTAIGREASRGATYGDGRAGPDREHARAEPFSGIAVLVRHTPPYVDNNAVPTAPCVDVYAGQRLAMRGTAIGREASRKST